MKKKSKKTGNAAGTAVQMLAGLVTGGLCGVLLISYLDPFLQSSGLTGTGIFLLMGGLFLSVILFSYLHIILHEGGHLIGGLLTGYRFSSFRIGSLMIQRKDGKITLHLLHIAGTGGQCLMIPPALEGGKCPVFAYNLGGPLFNILLAVIAGAVSFYVPSQLGTFALRLFALLGLFLGLTNGIPMRLGGVDNDGRNALSLTKDKAAMRAFWIQMQIAAQSAGGLRLKDMPAEWFIHPEPEQMQNNLIATLAVFHCNRLMDELHIPEAAAAIDELLQQENKILGLHRNLLRCDRLFCELVSGNRAEITAQLHTRELVKFMRSMRNYPSVLRTQYAWAKLGLRDEAAAAQIMRQFEKAADRYPYPSEIAGERELLALADAAK